MRSSFDARGHARLLGHRRQLVTIDAIGDDFERPEQARGAA
jgi:hypothetical protein